MAPFASQTREVIRKKWNGSITEAAVSDVVDGVQAVAHKIDKVSDPVTEPVSRQFSKVGKKISAKRTARFEKKLARVAAAAKEEKTA